MNGAMELHSILTPIERKEIISIIDSSKIQQTGLLDRPDIAFRYESMLLHRLPGVVELSDMVVIPTGISPLIRIAKLTGASAPFAFNKVASDHYLTLEVFLDSITVGGDLCFGKECVSCTGGNAVLYDQRKQRYDKEFYPPDIKYYVAFHVNGSRIAIKQ
jgi:hypothetical protein